MPSSATITAFYNFTANTKARATQVNANFDVFRGHLLPVDPSTATSANNTYDLGSTEHRWKDIYVANQINLGNLSTTAYLNESKLYFGATTTDSIELSKDSGTTSSEFFVKVNGSEVARFSGSGVNLTNKKTYLSTTTGSTLGSYPVGFILSGTVSSSNLLSSATTLSSVITVNAIPNRPLFLNVSPLAGNHLLIITGTITSAVSTSGSYRFNVQAHLCLDGSGYSTLTVESFRHSIVYQTSTAITQSQFYSGGSRSLMIMPLTTSSAFTFSGRLPNSEGAGTCIASAFTYMFYQP